MNSFVPLLLNLKNKKVVIFGAGNVALRKATTFSKYSNVIVISKKFKKEFDDLDIQKIKKEITKENVLDYIIDSFIVIPATNDLKINNMIADIAHSQKIMVNRVDEEKENDIIVPSIISKEDLIIAISTLGKSPMTSKLLREEIEKFITEEYLLMLNLQTKLRDYLKSNIKNQKEREKILSEIIKNKEIWDILKESRFEDAYQNAMEKVRKCIQI